MRSITIAGVILSAMALTGCAGLGSSMNSDWSCRAFAGGSCSDIATNDRVLENAQVSGIVEASAALPASQSEDRPTFYGRQVLRITFSSWVDSEGRFHAGGPVFMPYGRELWGTPQEDLEG